MFKVHLKRYSDNLESIKVELAAKEKDLEFFEEEIALRKGYNYALEPKFAYETGAEWKAYIEKVTQYAHDQKLKEKKAMIEKLKEGVLLEGARVRLISQGVPAWEGQFTADRLRQESANTQ